MSVKPPGGSGSFTPIPSGGADHSETPPPKGATPAGRTVSSLPEDAAKTSSKSTHLSSRPNDEQTGTKFDKFIESERVAKFQAGIRDGSIAARVKQAESKAVSEDSHMMRWDPYDDDSPLPQSSSSSSSQSGALRSTPPRTFEEMRAQGSAPGKLKDQTVLGPSEYLAQYDPDGMVAAAKFFTAMKGEEAAVRTNKEIFETVDNVIAGKSKGEVISLGKELLAAAHATGLHDVERAVACRIGKHYPFTGKDMAARKNEVAGLAVDLGSSAVIKGAMSPVALGLRIAIDPTTPNRVNNFTPAQLAAALKLGTDNL